MKMNVKPIKAIKYKLQDIFKDKWSDFLKFAKINNYNIRKVVLDEVSKIIDCGDPKMGYSLYYCPDCLTILHVPFRCKSRFCNTCGVKYSSDRALKINSKLLNCSHRHLVFTIPEQLRSYFRDNRKLLDILFKASSQTILSWFSERNKSENFTPGIVSVLHTFGRDLKWNPHIHMILSESASGNITVRKDFKHIPYEMLRKKWQHFLLKFLSANIKDEKIEVLKTNLYKEYTSGFYVYAKSDSINKNSFKKDSVDYIVRYTGRPVMAQSRILDYDGEYITFFYNRHEDEKMVTEKLTVFEFFKKLIIHIPENHFKMVRYFGIYAKKHKFQKKFSTKLSLNSKHYSHMIYLSSNWAKRILYTFGTNPLKCSCGGKMELLDVFYSRSSKYKNNFEFFCPT